MFSCFWSTMTYSTVAVMPFTVWLWPMGWTYSFSTAADRLGDQATAFASSRSTGILPQARAKGTDRFTSSTKAAKQAAKLPQEMPQALRFFREAFCLASARSAVLSRLSGTCSSSASRALYSSFRFIRLPPLPAPAAAIAMPFSARWPRCPGAPPARRQSLPGTGRRRTAG